MSTYDSRDVEPLVEALREAIELAEEGWSYASDYFREKWDCEAEIQKARSALERFEGEG